MKIKTTTRRPLHYGADFALASHPEFAMTRAMLDDMEVSCWQQDAWDRIETTDECISVLAMGYPAAAAEMFFQSDAG